MGFNWAFKGLKQKKSLKTGVKQGLGVLSSKM
jgi:hypothetical protein